MVGFSRSRCLASALALALSAFAIGGTLPQAGPVALAASTPRPNQFDPATRAASIAGAPAPRPAPASSARSAGAGRQAPVARPAAQPVTAAVDPAHAVHLTSADAALDVEVPAGAVSSGDVALAGGAMSIAVRQIAPPAGGTAGGSGHFTFGTYLVQTLDANGHVAAHGLRQPLGLTLHYAGRAAALDVGHAVATINGSLPRGVQLDPAAAAGRPARAAGNAPTSPAAGLGRTVQRTPTVDRQAMTLATTAPASTASTTVSFATVAPVAAFGGPGRFETNLSAGSLVLPQALNLPAGPGGLTPPLSLNYDSASVTDQHNPAAAALWAGEGWNLSLGAITWAERDTALGCCPNPDFNSTWNLADAFGTAAELIPPAKSVSTYYDDFNGTAITPSPVAWHTTPDTHARVISFTGPNALPGMAAVPPCFRVFLTSGIMEEFGCTPDSLQFFPQPSGPNTGLDYIASWLLDLITDPRGNQIHVTYQQDVQAGAAGVSYPRDAVMATVEYDSPGCHDAQHACTGAAWAPLMRVSFQAGHTVARPVGASCPANGSLRCDDPVDLSAAGGLATPSVESTFVLNDVLVQVRSSGAAAWSTLRDYQLAYDQSGPSTITDPFSGVAQSTAGRLNLTRITEVGDDGVTALPSRSFSYTRQVQLYEDEFWGPAPATNCGPAWNVGAGQGCNLWSQSYEGNSYYLSVASNGLGLQQTFSWQLARDNARGVPTGLDALNPLACDPANVQATKPCDLADAGAWSRMVLTQRTETVVRLSQAGQGGAQTSTPVTGTYTYSYRLAPIDNYWGAWFDADVVDFYNGKWMGFNSATVTNPDGAREVHTYPASLGFGVFNPSDPMFSTSCTSTAPCPTSPWWDPSNAEHGLETEVDRFNADGSLQKVVRRQYRALCPSSGVAGDLAGNLVSELDFDNPLALCDVKPVQEDSLQVDGGSQTTAPHQTVTYAYDTFGRLVTGTTTSSDGGATGSPTSIVGKITYVWNDAVSATASSATGSYLIDAPAFVDVEDTAGNRYKCRYASYDGQPLATGQTSGLRLGEPTRTDTYTSCGTAANGFTPSGQISTTSTYDVFGNAVATNDPDAVAGNAAHVGCTVGSGTFSACQAYDGTFGSLPVAGVNALNQRSMTGYQATAAGGFGLWPVSAADANGNASTSTYDALGRQTGTTLPGEGAGLTTQATSYTVWCAGAAGQAPCVEIDHTQRLSATATVTSRSFYDGLGRLVETRSPAPGGQDVVSYSLYDASQRLAFRSLPYFVAAYTGAPGAAAYSIPDSTKPGTTSVYDGQGRVTSAIDPLSHTIANAYSQVCGAAGTGDSACYTQVLTTDPAGHRGGSLRDALGRIVYEQRYTGSTAASYAVYATLKYAYDFVGEQTQVVQPDGVTKTTVQYDMAGRKIAMTDPDLGSQTFAYDQVGNLVQSTDARGTAGTVFIGYDGLNRPLWHNTQNSPTGAYYTYSYDSTAGGNVGLGRLTGETFSASWLSGSYTFTYDARGQQVAKTMTVGGVAYPQQATFDDGGNQATQTYPDGETVTNAYTAQGWLSGVSTRQGTTTTTLLGGAAYAGAAGAAGEITAASLGSANQYSAADDLLGRATDRRVTTNGGVTLYDQALTYDAAGNVATERTTLPTGTDNQAFCYDEQNRLTWAGSTGTPPCTGSAIAAGTLGAAQYTQSFTYDAMGRLTGGPLGSYAYANAAHTHAATAIGTGYTASYDVAGHMTCRAPSTSATCAGAAPTGAQLAYDNEGQLASWQSAPSAPNASVQFLYDCQGVRVAQRATQAGAATTTVYAGGLEEVSTSGSSTTVRTYYHAAGHLIAMAVNGAFSFLVSDGLGSATVALGAGGGATAGQLFTPYGAVRYANGAMPTSIGFTGQRADALTGLYYYGARYYDPVAGQFASADTVMPGGGFNLEGLSRYAYTRGNPVSRTDPTGHDDFGGGFDGGGFDTGSFDSSGFDTSQLSFDSFNIDPSAQNFIGGDFTNGSFDNAQPSSMTVTDALANAEGPQVTASEVSAVSSGLSSVGSAIGSWMSQVSQMFTVTDGEGLMVTPEQVDATSALINGAGQALAAEAQAVNQLYQTTDGENMMVTQEEVDACMAAHCGFGLNAGVTAICSCFPTGGGYYGVNFQYTVDNGFDIYGVYTAPSNGSVGFTMGPSVDANFTWGGGGAWDSGADGSGTFDQVQGNIGPVTAGYFQSTQFGPGGEGYQGVSLGLGPGALGTPYGMGATTTTYTPGLFATIASWFR
jgi:RHS repeat-associated protein